MTVKARHEGSAKDAAPRRVAPKDLEAERDHDEADKPRDHGLQLSEAPRLQAEDGEGKHARQQSRDEKWDAEHEVDPQRRAHKLGEVGRHRDELRLYPQEDDDRARKLIAANLGQAMAGRDA